MIDTLKDLAMIVRCSDCIDIPERLELYVMVQGFRDDIRDLRQEFE